MRDKWWGAQHGVRRRRQVDLAQDARTDSRRCREVDSNAMLRSAVLIRCAPPTSRRAGRRGVVEGCRRAPRTWRFSPLAAVLDALDHAQALLVVAVERLRLGDAEVDPLVARQAARVSASPVCPKGRVPQVVAERDGLRRDPRSAQRAGDGAEADHRPSSVCVRRVQKWSPSAARGTRRCLVRQAAERTSCGGSYRGRAGSRCAGCRARRIGRGRRSRRRTPRRENSTCSRCSWSSR